MDHQELYQRLSRFATDVTEFARPLLDHPVTSRVADQLMRAADGAASNYRASNYGRTNREFRSSLAIALQEADEARHWLEQMVTTKLASGETVFRLLGEAVELTRILGASKRTANRNARSKRPDRVKPPPRRRRLRDRQPDNR